MARQDPSVNPIGPGSDAVSARLAGSIERWKRSLLDLTKRNRALNFRITRLSTVAIVDEEPAEVFRQLWAEEQSMRFAATEAARRSDRAQSEALARDEPEWARDDDGGEAGTASLEFAAYSRGSREGARADRVLQTASAPDHLDKALRRIDEQARVALEEQGVNTLFLALGMLHYRESLDSEETLRAPLVLLPVTLERKSARVGFVLSATDEEPLFNPSLAEYLRRDFGMVMPDLVTGGDEAGSVDLGGWLETVAELTRERPGWKVTGEIYLGLFAFQKFVMYKDLEVNSGACAGHRLVCQLVMRSGTVLGLPDDVRSADLDRDHPPESSYQVVDADASQLRGLVAVARGHDLVIEGPPGTGKSQTITNLVAQAMSQGKSVLFVAEKMAALQVVHRRLVQAGLGEFCLELHSTKGNKRLVMKELAAALDASLQRAPAPEVSATRLAEVRQELTTYVQALHAPHGALGLSPYRVYGELGKVRDAPKLPWSGALERVTREDVERAVRDLRELSEAVRPIGDPATHPWRDAQRAYYSEEDLERIEAMVADVRARLAEIRALAHEVGATLGIPRLDTLAALDTLADIEGVLSRCPGAPIGVLSSAAWNVPDPDALGLIRAGRLIQELRQRVLARFTPAVMELDHAADIELIEAKLRGRWRQLALLDGRYRSIRKRWRQYRLPSYRPTLKDQAREMKVVHSLRQARASLVAREDAARGIFGSLWHGEESQWDQLERYLQWVTEFRRVVTQYGLTEPAIDVASRGVPDLSGVAKLRTAGVAAGERLAELGQLVGWPTGYLTDSPLDEADARLMVVAERPEEGPRWAAFETVRARVAAGVAGQFLPAAMDGAVPFDGLAPAFLRAFYQRWLDEVVALREPLRRFQTLTHESRAEEFRDLDRAILLANRAALVARMRDTVQARLRDPAVAQPMAVLRREMARQRRLSPLRLTMRHAEPAIRAIKPCLMMSPLSVAQFIRGEAPSFDLVVFDEASQLPPEDAIGAIIRASQLVVVGDPKQLPPTNFFTVMDDAELAPLAEDGTPLYTDGESILEEFLGAGVPQSRLRWHYRSLHESLITFSNVSFYDADLFTFPSVERDSASLGLRFEYVADGVYEGKGLNRAEARRVADAVVDHARTHPDLTLGVGTFSLRQQLAIQDELEVRRREDPGLESFFSREAAEPFFVKNLENIQGDERDVIFISVTYAKAADGRLRYQFGPLNTENGWRRLNVLVTRGRRRMHVFSSIRGDDISVAASASQGARLLKEFLHYAESGRLESSTVTTAAETESLFEREVFLELTRRGLTLQPQIGVSGYRIDFGVLDDAVPGRFLCGIECDGVAYHASETARDRDRLRQQVLEARGWTIHRIWSTDWFKDRLGQIERVLRLVGETRSQILAELETVAAAQLPRGKDLSGEPNPSLPGDPVAPTAPSAPPDYVRPTVPSYRLAPGSAGFGPS